MCFGITYAYNLQAKLSGPNPRFLQQIGRRGRTRLFHHRQQDAAGGFGVGLGVVAIREG